jgi:hypothetical protein
MRLSHRFTARGVADCGDYQEMLTGARLGPQEMDQLVGELAVGETYFFRHKEQFDLMRIVPDLLERNKETRSLRIWSAGCATGAEPCSVSVFAPVEISEPIERLDCFHYGGRSQSRSSTARRSRAIPGLGSARHLGEYESALFSARRQKLARVMGGTPLINGLTAR